MEFPRPRVSCKAEEDTRTSFRYEASGLRRAITCLYARYRSVWYESGFGVCSHDVPRACRCFENRYFVKQRWLWMGTWATSWPRHRGRNVAAKLVQVVTIPNRQRAKLPDVKRIDRSPHLAGAYLALHLSRIEASFNDFCPRRASEIEFRRTVD